MKFPEQFRANPKGVPAISSPGDPFGAFLIGTADSPHGRALRIIACDGMETGWEHVSVTILNANKCPSWPEMCLVKRLFWDAEECVVQFHPPASDYVNVHPGCLHLWKYADGAFPVPPSYLVG